jgi:glycosyltransferase involved in cell wall biosynthesis
MGRDIIIVGLQAWHTDIGSNCKSIAAELSKRHRVLYVNAPLDRNTILREKDGPHVRKHQAIREGKAPRLEEVRPNLWSYYPESILESINWIPNTSLFSLANRVNNRRFATDIRKAARELGFSRYVLFNDNDIFRTFYLKELLRPDVYVYYSRDNLVGVDYWKRHGLKLEPRHIAKADLGTANSSYLASYLRRYNDNSAYIGQGCNLALFDANKEHALPADLENIPRPLVGFVGAINTIRLDPEVIRVLATQRPGYNLALVGPEDEWWRQCDLHGLPNVHFLGKKPMEALPAYVAAFDVCINPQKLNPVTIGNYPLKVDEYLAMGKPVVATRTEAMDVFGDCAYMADRPEDYPKLVDRALLEDNEERRCARKRLASGHTWEQSVALLEEAILKTKP